MNYDTSNTSNPIDTPLNWLFCIDDVDTPAILAAQLPWTSWVRYQHPIVSHGEVATLLSCLEAPWQNLNSTVAVTFTADGYMSSAEICVGFGDEVSAQEALTNAASYPGHGERETFLVSPFDTNLQGKPQRRVLQELWWRDERYIHQALAVTFVEEVIDPAVPHPPHAVIV